MMKTIEGKFRGKGKKIAIVMSRFNDVICEQLVKGANDALLRHDVAADDITLFKCPGAFEIPVVAARVAETKKYDAIICLGAVIRGSTPHFEFVAGQCASGVASVGLQYKMPVIFGVLTTDTIEQAVERAGSKAGNKGYDAAVTALEMIDLFANL